MKRAVEQKGVFRNVIQPEFSWEKKHRLCNGTLSGGETAGCDDVQLAGFYEWLKGTKENSSKERESTPTLFGQRYVCEIRRALFHNLI